MSIKLSDSIRVGQQKPLEDKYFNELVPYTSTTQVNDLLPKAVRHRGLTVNINGEEYWYKDGIEDSNLVPKIPSIPTMTNNYYGLWDDTNKKFINGQLSQDTNGNIGIGATPTNSKLEISPLVNQTALKISNYSLTGSNNQPALDINGTWNTSSTPTLIKANVTDTTSNTNSLLMDLRVGDVSKMKITKDGTVSGNIADFYQFRSFNGLATIFLTGNYLTAQSEVVGHIKTLHTFSGNLGANRYISFLSQPTINQTGGANGITRGLYVNPTLTSAADWRSIEWSNNTGYGLYGAGSAKNYLEGNLGIGKTSPVEKLDVNGNVKAIDFKGKAVKFDLQASITPTPNTLVPKADGSGLMWYDNNSVLRNIGENFFSADLSNTTARNHTMNAGVTVKTLGNPHTLSGLPNKNADVANFRKVRVQNASGLDSVVDSKNLLTDGVTSMTDAEKDAWRIAQRKTGENYNTSTPQILVVNPFLIKNTDDFPLAVTVTGSNLFIDLANSIVTMKRVKDSNGNTVSDAEINITQYVRNSESNNLIMLIYYNFYNVTTGYYELKIQNQYGLQNLTSPQFLVVENYDLTPMLPFTVINSNNQLVDNTTINNNAFEVNLVSNVYGGILFDKLYNSTNGNINCIFDLNLSIRIPRSDYVFGEIFLGLINNDSTNNISPITFPKIGFRISNINAWSAKITDVNTNNVLHTFSWTNNDLVYYSKFKIFIKDGTYTITNVITGQVSQGFYNDFNELRFLISKTYSTSMAGGVLSVSVSNFKKL